MTRTCLAVAVTLCLVLAGCTGPDIAAPWAPHGDPIDSVQVNDFTLTTSEGEPWNYAEQAANTTLVVAFLFTNCLDICPVVTHNMKWVKSQLTSDELNRTTFLTVTVDPWRDNVTVLHEWKTGTSSEWTHLTVTNNDTNSEPMQRLQNVWLNFGVGLTVEDTNSSAARHHPDDYTINHETGTVLVDRFGKQRVWWGDNDWVLDLFLEDLRHLLTL